MNACRNSSASTPSDPAASARSRRHLIGKGAGAALRAIPLVLLAACQPRIALEAPKDPIVINLNVKIEQEVRVKVEKDVENLLDDNEDLF